MNIIRYIGKRLLFIVPQLIGIVLVCFILVKAIPGDPATLMLGPMASDESISRLRRELGLEKPLPVQFLIYIENLTRGDMGKSWQTTKPVFDDLLLRLPATLELITFGLLGALLIGIPLGVISAHRKRGIISKVAAYYGLRSEERRVGKESRFR